MNKTDRSNAAAAVVAFGLFGGLSLYMAQYSDHPTEAICMGFACFAVASFVAGYLNCRGVR